MPGPESSSTLGNNVFSFWAAGMNGGAIDWCRSLHATFFQHLQLKASQFPKPNHSNTNVPRTIPNASALIIMAQPYRSPTEPRSAQQADEEPPFDPMDTDATSPQTPQNHQRSGDSEKGTTNPYEAVWTLDRDMRDQVLEVNRTMREATQDALETLPKYQKILFQTLCFLTDLTEVLTDHSKASLRLLWRLEELNGLLAEERYATEPL